MSPEQRKNVAAYMLTMAPKNDRKKKKATTLPPPAAMSRPIPFKKKGK